MSDSYDRLLEVIDALLAPGGCPWDQEQTPLTLCDYIVEEAFELVEAIRAGDAAEAAEELGDLMFLLSFLARCYEKEPGREPDAFLEQALVSAREKMIRRHPHVFGETTVQDASEVLANWERIKRRERQGDDGATDAAQPPRKGVFHSLPKGLPPLLKAYRIHSKAARNGFTWASDEDLRTQLDDEWREWEAAVADGDQAAMEAEFGDYLFTLAELGRRHKIKANAALDFANLKFLRRFEMMEAAASAQGRDVADMSLDELNHLWDQAKADE